MARYIDADYLDKLITQLNSEGRGITRNEYKMIDNILFEFPAADVVERKIGTWVFEDRNPVNRKLKTNEFAYCDQCGGTAPGYPFWEGDLELTKFCPHCGARML